MASKAKSPAAEICLYGNRETGAGYLARIASEPGKFYGTGDPVRGRSFTEAIFLADIELREAGLPNKSAIRIFAPGGERYADVKSAAIPCYGALDWKDAAKFAFVLPVEAICTGDPENAADCRCEMCGG